MTHGPRSRTVPRSQRCEACGKRKPLASFYQLHRGERRRQKRCKPCDNRSRVGRILARRIREGQILSVQMGDFVRDPARWMRMARRTGAPVYITDTSGRFRATLSIPGSRSVIR